MCVLCIFHSILAKELLDICFVKLVFGYWYDIWISLVSHFDFDVFETTLCEVVAAVMSRLFFGRSRSLPWLHWLERFFLGVHFPDSLFLEYM